MHVSVQVYDVLGISGNFGERKKNREHIAFNSLQTSFKRSVAFNRLMAGNFQAIKKMIILK